MFWQLTDSILYWLSQNEQKSITDGFGKWYTLPIPDLDNATTYHHVFDHTQLNNDRNKLYSNGSAAQLIAVNTAMNYAEMLERAFRARHATIIQSYGQAISRCLAQKHEVGIFNVLRSYVEKMSQIPLRT